MRVQAWEEYVASNFAGYLLKASAARGISAQSASRFLERLSGRPNQLRLLRAAATLAPRLSALEGFILRDLPDLIRALPSRSNVESTEWEGGFSGRLDVVRTLKRHLGGQRTRFVTTSRRRSFDLPENVLVRSVAQRLHETLVELRTANVLSSAGWGALCPPLEGALAQLLTSSVLREVPLRELSGFDRQAASNARHRSYGTAHELDRVLYEGLLADDPQVIAKVVAEGALSPLEPAKRFELAVLLRLIQSIADYVEQHEPGRWTLERCVIDERRHEVARLVREDGACVDVFYDRSELDAGLCDTGVKHYFSHQGRLRPDITITLSRGTHRRAVVIEVKHSENQSYLVQGFQEAALYRWEYADVLTGWPKAVLVGSGAIDGALRSDDVVAVGWANWVPTEIIKALVAFPGDASN